MVQRYAEQKGVVFRHFFQAAAQGEDEIQARVMLHEMTEVVENVTFKPSGPDFLVEADHLVHHQDQVVPSQG